MGHLNYCWAFTMRLSIILSLGLLMVSPSAMAGDPSHCAPNEEVIWSCSSKNKTFELCASKDLGAASGYMQYRAGPPGKPEFVFPSKLVSPKGFFHYSLLAQGAQLSFTQGQYEYNLTEPLKGNASIWVLKGDEKAKLAVSCQKWSDTLTLTSTLDRFKSIGIYE